jgi:uncharacterized Fe-S center protein
MKSQVWFADLDSNGSRSLISKIQDLMTAAGISKVVNKLALTAVKIHFGERGNTAFIRPLLVRPVVDAVREAGGRPFLTDANTLYVGTRGNAVDHLNTACLNGFAYSVVGAPVIIADGINGEDEVSVPVTLQNCREVFVASAIAKSDALISLAHFKLHEASGFGGAIKNVGMGSASRRGKMAQHSDVAPQVIAKKCVGCGTCRDQCAHSAISLVERSEGKSADDQQAPSKIAVIDQERCVGCARCIHVCPHGALGIDWEKDLPRFMERMVEYTAGVLKGKEKRCLFVNYLTQISPACDCYPFADAPIVPDIGILASRDPVAIDQASIDLVNAQTPLCSSSLKDLAVAATDKVKAVYPHIDWRHQLEYAERIGLGSRNYELVRLHKEARE